MAEQGEDLTASTGSLPPNDRAQIAATTSTNSDPKPSSETFAENAENAENAQNAPSLSTIIQPTSVEPNAGQDAEAVGSKAADESRPDAGSVPTTDSVGVSPAAADSQPSPESEPALVTNSATKAEAAGDAKLNESTSNKADDYEKRIAKLEGQIKELQEHPTRLYSRLEDRVRTIENPDGKTTSSSTTAKDKSDKDKRDYTQFCRALPQINFMTIDEWDRRKVSLKTPHAALDVVVSSKVELDKSKEAYGLNIKFMQLNSIPALYAWAKIIHGTVDPEKDLSKPMIILAPFKNLTVFAEEISKAYEKLEPEWGSRAISDPEATVELRWQSDKTAMDGNANKNDDQEGAGDVSQSTNSEAPRTVKDAESSNEPLPTERREGSVSPIPMVTTTDTADGTGSKVKNLGSTSATSDGSECRELKSEALGTEPAATDTSARMAMEAEAPAAVLACPENPGEKGPSAQETVTAVKRQVLGSENYSQDALNEQSYDAYLGLRTLLHFYTEFLEPRWNRLRSSRFEEVGEVNFSDLCELFQPGDDVYATDEPQRVWRVIRVTGGRPKLVHFVNPTAETAEESGADINTGVRQKEDTEASIWTPLRISGYHLDYDGTNFGPSGVSHTVEYYPGAKRIDSLKFWPLRFSDEESRFDLTKHGRLFYEKCQPGLHHYEGPTVSESPKGLLLSSVGPAAPPNVTSQIYVDVKKAFELHPKWAPSFKLVHTNVQVNQTESGLEATDFKDRGSESNLRRWIGADDVFRFQTIGFPEQNASNRYLKKDRWINDNEAVKTSDRSRIEPHDQTLLPNRLFGFVLQSREWACFNVDPKYLKESARDPTAWKELQLPGSHKRNLQALVEFHFENKRAMKEQGVSEVEFDVIPGKGKGLVVLLHGPPGLGKTMTAESIAKKYGKPLLPITCGSISIKPQTIETKLRENFQLAQDWDAIILMDEADVFVTQRSFDGLTINAIVSVFIRALEYYTGVLFLTTNRVGQFDEALLSRINLTLYYPELELDSTLTIWDNNLTRVLQQQNITQGTGRNIMDWVREHFQQDKQSKQSVLNGRQIRMAFESAVALAHLEAKESRAKGDTDAKTVLKVEHFEDVVKRFKHFDDYIEDARGHSHKVILAEAGVRSPSWNPDRETSPMASTPVSSAASREMPHANLSYRKAPFSPSTTSPQTPSRTGYHSTGPSYEPQPRTMSGYGGQQQQPHYGPQMSQSQHHAATPGYGASPRLSQSQPLPAPLELHSQSQYTTAGAQRDSMLSNQRQDYNNPELRPQLQQQAYGQFSSMNYQQNPPDMNSSQQ